MFALLFVSFPVVEAVLPRLHSINRDIADAVVEPFDNLNWKHFRREGGMRRAQADITVRTRCARTCLPTRRSCLSCAFILSFFFFFIQNLKTPKTPGRVSLAVTTVLAARSARFLFTSTLRRDLRRVANEHRTIVIPKMRVCTGLCGSCDRSSQFESIS